MPAKSIKKRYILLLGLAVFFSSWRLLTPWVVIHYDAEEQGSLKTLWNVNHHIYRGDLTSGKATSEKGNIFADSDFFMVFFWWDNKNLDRCIDITPRLGRTINIYLNASAKIDTTKTSQDVIARLKACDQEPDPFRP